MDFVKQACSVARALECNFFVKNKPISIEDAMQRTAFLPAIMRRADQLASFCLGYGLGLTFDRSTKAMLGVKVDFNDKVPNSLRLLCFTDVLIEIVQSAPSHSKTPLDDLLRD